MNYSKKMKSPLMRDSSSIDTISPLQGLKEIFFLCIGRCPMPEVSCAYSAANQEAAQEDKKIDLSCAFSVTDMDYALKGKKHCIFCTYNTADSDFALKGLHTSKQDKVLCATYILFISPERA